MTTGHFVSSSRVSLHLQTSSPSEEKVNVVESVVRVLNEAIDNGVQISVPRSDLSTHDLRRIHRNLASRAWEKGDLPGESPPIPLHHEHNGWGVGFDSEPEGQAGTHRLPWLILAMDAIDFLSTLMTPGETLCWREEAQ